MSRDVRSRAARRLAWTLAGLICLTVACAPDRAPLRPASAAVEAPPFLYVAVGGSDSVGVGSDEPLRQSWPQVFYRRALPRRATFVNLGVPGATVDAAFPDQAQEAVSLSPQLVTLWLNVTEVLLGVPVDAYEADLSRLVRLLRRAGATEVLVANVPLLDHLPAYLACRAAPRSPTCPIARDLPPSEVLGARVESFNLAIAAVADREGAILVDLHAAGLRARQDGVEQRLVAEDGFHLSTEGHDAVASAFAEAWKRRHDTPAPATAEVDAPPASRHGTAAVLSAPTWRLPGRLERGSEH